MITIHNLSREAYTEILKVMPLAIQETEQEYDTVTIVLTPATDISTNNKTEYVTLAHGKEFISISYNHFQYIKII